jgi:glycine dehydrogenase subunit 2
VEVLRDERRHCATSKPAGCSLDEALIFERELAGRQGSTFRRGIRCRRGVCPPSWCARPIEGFPEVSEPEVLRHFLRLSQWNFGTATTFYPLGRAR